MNSLDELREEIDSVDNDLIELIAKRMAVVEKVVQIKQELSIPVVNENREAEVAKKWEEKAKKLNLDSEHLSRILKDILAMSVDYQKSRFEASKP